MSSGWEVDETTTNEYPCSCGKGKVIGTTTKYSSTKPPLRFRDEKSYRTICDHCSIKKDNDIIF